MARDRRWPTHRAGQRDGRMWLLFDSGLVTQQASRRSHLRLAFKDTPPQENIQRLACGWCAWSRV